MNKNKAFSLLSAAFISIISTSTITAKPQELLVDSTPSQGAPLYSMTTTTPGGIDSIIDEVKVFIGKKNAEGTCNPNYPIEDRKTTEGKTLYVYNETDYLTANNIANAFGEEQGCFKVEMIYNGKTYSTGNVALVWDTTSHQYVAAIPSTGAMDFTS
jgi:hypothetical protein